MSGWEFPTWLTLACSWFAYALLLSALLPKEGVGRGRLLLGASFIEFSLLHPLLPVTWMEASTITLVVMALQAVALISWFSAILAPGEGPRRGRILAAGLTLVLAIGMWKTSGSLPTVLLAFIPLGMAVDLIRSQRLKQEKERLELARRREQLRGLRHELAQRETDLGALPAPRDDRRRKGPVDLAPLRELAAQLRHPGPAAEVLPAIVEGLRQSHGFAHAILRVRDPRSDLYELRASAGLDEDALERFRRPVVVDRYRKSIEAAGGSGRSCRISGEDLDWPDRFQRPSVSSVPPTNGVGPQEGNMLVLAGREDDLLVVPLPAESGPPIAYLCADMPGGESLPDGGALEVLELMVSYAALALQGSRLISRLEQVEAQLDGAHARVREEQSLRDTFLANVSHELRTPLTAIKAYAEMMQRSMGELDPDALAQFSEVILQEGGRLETVFDSLLSVRELDGGRGRLLRDRFDLAELCREQVEVALAGFRTKDIDLALDLPTERLRVHGDRAALSTVIEHLLGNALKFTPTGGKVRLSLCESGGQVELSLEDSGMGIPPEECSRVFDRFYQVDGSSTREFGGQGLGLSICRDIIDGHHGRIHAGESSLGGARFAVELPRLGFLMRQDPNSNERAVARVRRESVLQDLLSMVGEALESRAISLMLVDGDGLRVEAAIGLEEDVVQSSNLSRGEGVAGTVWETGSTLRIANLHEDERFRGRGLAPRYPHPGLLSVPLRRGVECIGVLNLNDPVDGRNYDGDDQLLAEAIAQRAVEILTRLANWQGGDERLSAADDALGALLSIGRERRTRRRRQVVSVGLEVGRRMNLGEAEMADLAWVLRSYDLGLADLDPDLLQKSGELDPHERALIEDHVSAGAMALANLGDGSGAWEALRHHHENFDGSGYPGGLSGVDIPAAARILRMVDSFAALVHGRSHRPGFSPEEALDLLAEGVGQRFCPEVAEHFLALAQERQEEFLPQRSTPLPQR